jgi:PPOX class probable F420-dependent enzyme
VATLATNVANGPPQVSVVWIDVDGDDLRINTAIGRWKLRHIERDHRVGVTVIDPDDSYNILVVRGTVHDMRTEGADAHIDALAKKYLGAETYPWRRPDEQRIMLYISTDSIVAQPQD